MPELIRERGSILVTVLGLSMVMSLAAAGLLLVAGNAQNDEDQEFIRQRCFNDAESGLIIGAAWLKHHLNAQSFIPTDQGWAGAPFVLFTDSLYDNGSKVTVSITDNVPNTKTVNSKAVLGNLTLKYSWDIGLTGANEPPPDNAPILSLANWRATP